MKPTYFTTADGRVVRGEAVCLPVLAMNYEFGVGLAVYIGEASNLNDATLMAWTAGFKPLQYNHRPAPPVRVRQSGHSVIASNGETYHEWIEVPLAARDDQS
jgi:hypothetical protein